ncbi:MAG: hypothetical protein QXG17_00730 [Sulfolobales archaeon]
MSVLIYVYLAVGVAIGLLFRSRKIKRYVDMGLSALIYGLVFLVGLNSGKVLFSTVPSSRSETCDALAILGVVAKVVLLALAPTFTSLLLAVVLSGGRSE